MAMVDITELFNQRMKEELERDKSNFDERGQSIKLFAPGPTYVPYEILAEMSKPNETHRSKSYQQLHRMLREKMQRLLQTKNDVLSNTSNTSNTYPITQ